MADPREEREKLEELLVGPLGVRARDSAGRAVREEESSLRTCFQRDADRITHSKAFRRLKHKTQVFLQPEGDHYRTRLTHTLEVTRLARTVARALMLNEDLAEAIALGHDLGHTPFGHAGERALNTIYSGGFRHYEQSLRVVDRIEKDGRGLNLCRETRIGILAHTTGHPDESRESMVVRLCDHVAYLNHDLDDALRAGIVTEGEVPDLIHEKLGTRSSRRIDTFIRDIVDESRCGRVDISEGLRDVWDLFHEFMNERVYRGIWDHYFNHTGTMPEDYRAIADRDGLDRAVTDYVSGMTDDYAIEQYGKIYIPMAWSVK